MKKMSEAEEEVKNDDGKSSPKAEKSEDAGAGDTTASTPGGSATVGKSAAEEAKMENMLD